MEDKAIYPHNLGSIYPQLDLDTRLAHHSRQTSSQLRVKSLSSRSVIRYSHEQGHVKRGSSSRTVATPPVPPLPQNVHFLAPINPTSHLPLAGGRIGLSLPVRLPAMYPRICPCELNFIVEVALTDIRPQIPLRTRTSSYIRKFGVNLVYERQ